MSTISCISFDLDGTLVDADYTTWVWEVGVPELYARKNNIPIAEATARIVDAYAAVGDTSLLWYDLEYWFDLLKLPGSWCDLLDEHRHRIRLFPEVPEVLKRLQNRYDLIVASNAAREFVDREVEATGIRPYFSRIISATSDFHLVKKTPAFYRRLCSIAGADPAAIVHVGDHYDHDYLAPRQNGLIAYYLDRPGTSPEQTGRIRNLSELVERLLGSREE